MEKNHRYPGLARERMGKEEIRFRERKIGETALRGDFKNCCCARIFSIFNNHHHGVLFVKGKWKVNARFSCDNWKCIFCRSDSPFFYPHSLFTTNLSLTLFNVTIYRFNNKYFEFVILWEDQLIFYINSSPSVFNRKRAFLVLILLLQFLD